MINEEIIRKFNREKILKLVAAILIDSIGYLSYLIPGLGEVADAFWGSISAILIFILFKKNIKVAFAGAVFGGVEEITPGLDFIPTATLLWVVVYVKGKEKALMNYMENRSKEYEIINKYQKKIEKNND